MVVHTRPSPEASYRPPTTSTRTSFPTRTHLLAPPTLASFILLWKFRIFFYSQISKFYLPLAPGSLFFWRDGFRPHYGGFIFCLASSVTWFCICFACPGSLYMSWGMLYLQSLHLALLISYLCPFRSCVRSV